MKRQIKRSQVGLIAWLRMSDWAGGESPCCDSLWSVPRIRLFCNHITSHKVCSHTKTLLLVRVKESSNVMMTPLDLLLSSLQPLLLAPPVSHPPSPALLLFLSLVMGSQGVHRGERAGAVGNKCLIIRLIIIPGGCDLDNEAKGGE